MKTNGLAAYVLQDRADWPPERIAATLAAGRPVRVNLPHGPPVYLVYLTVFGRDGEVFFRDDIYDRDVRLIRALAAASRIAARPSLDRRADPVLFAELSVAAAPKPTKRESR